MKHSEALLRITARPDVFGGKPIVRDIRISVEHVLSLLSQGITASDILQDYPELEPEDIRACTAYAHAVIARDRPSAVSLEMRKPTPMLVSRPSSFTAYGVDGCSAGWFFVALESSGRIRSGVVSALAELVKTADRSDRIFVDIPIGLPDGAEGRDCDTAARKVLGPRRSSVFSAPVREVLEAKTCEQANRVSKAVAGRGISKQAFAIVPKIREVDRLLRRRSAARGLIREVHPELCFLGTGRARAHERQQADSRGIS